MIPQKKYQKKFLQEKNLGYQKKVLFFVALINIIRSRQVFLIFG
jgi:hypothetical protein